MILQYFYRPVLNFIYNKVTQKISIEIRNLIIYICFLLIFIIQFMTIYKPLGILNANIRDLSVGFLFGIIIIFSVKDKLQIIRWNKLIYILYTIVALMILAAGIHHYMGPSYRVFPLTMLVAFMCLFFVWGNRGDYDVLFSLMAKAYLTFSAGIIVLCFLIYPYPIEGLWYYSVMDINPNGFSKIMLPALFSAVYLIVLEPIKKINIIYTIIGGISAHFIYITDSRAGQICEIAIILLGIIFYLRALKMYDGGWLNIRIIIRNIIVIVLLFVVAIFCSSFVLGHITPVTSGYLVQSEEENTTEVSDVTDENESESPQPGSIEYLVMEGNELIRGNEFLKELNVFMAQRIAMWAVYIKNMSLTGHDDFLNPYGPHNQYIEFAYKAGVPAGVLWLLFNIIVGILLLYRVIKYRDKYIVFQLFGFIVFFVTSMLDTGVMPFTRSFIFIYYIILAPVFIKKCDKKTIP